jgi:hypothetical protein
MLIGRDRCEGSEVKEGNFRHSVGEVNKNCLRSLEGSREIPRSRDTKWTTTRMQRDNKIIAKRIYSVQ